MAAQELQQLSSGTCSPTVAAAPGLRSAGAQHAPAHRLPLSRLVEVGRSPRGATRRSALPAPGGTGLGAARRGAGRDVAVSPLGQRELLPLLMA